MNGYNENHTQKLYFTWKKENKSDALFKVILKDIALLFGINKSVYKRKLMGVLW